MSEPHWKKQQARTKCMYIRSTHNLGLRGIVNYMNIDQNDIVCLITQ